MPTQASGLFKIVASKLESTWGVAPGTGGSGILPRVASTLSLRKGGFRSNTIRPDAQIIDFRHGVRSIGGNIQGELQPKTYEDFFSAMFRANWTAGTVATFTATTTLAATASSKHLTLGGTDAPTWAGLGFKNGDVIRLVGTSQNTLLNIRLLDISGTGGTVATTDAAIVDMAAQTTGTATVTGKKLVTPNTGLIDKSLAIEHFYSDITQSELFLGCKPTSAAISIPVTGLGTVNFTVMGKDWVTNTAQYYVSPADAPTYGLVAGVNGALSVAGVDVAVVTAFDCTINGGHTPGAVVGSNATTFIFPGILDISGRMTAYFQDAALRNLFDNETPASLDVMLTVGNAANADFIKFFLPKIKVNTGDKDDRAGPITQTMSFQALKDTTTTVSDESTMVMQDSQAT